MGVPKKNPGFGGYVPGCLNPVTYRSNQTLNTSQLSASFSTANYSTGFVHSVLLTVTELL